MQRDDALDGALHVLGRLHPRLVEPRCEVVQVDLVAKELGDQRREQTDRDGDVVAAVEAFDVFEGLPLPVLLRRQAVEEGVDVGTAESESEFVVESLVGVAPEFFSSSS